MLVGSWVQWQQHGREQEGGCGVMKPENPSHASRGQGEMCWESKAAPPPWEKAKRKFGVYARGLRA